MAEDPPEKKRVLGGLVAAVVVAVGIISILWYLVGNALG